MSGIARAASVIALGNVTSRVLGLMRETVKAHLFGAGVHVDALQVALILPIQIYELLTGGLVNSALVPVFSDYASRGVDDREGERAELWRLASTLLTLITVVFSALLAAAALFTPQLAWLISGGLEAEGLALTARLLRITLPAVLFLSLSGVLTGMLYSLKRFTLPAFTAAIFNAGMVLVTLVFAQRMSVSAMALGLLAGAMAQVALQLPGLRDARLRPLLTLNHPGLRRIFSLYVPIIFGLFVTQASIYIGLNLASRTGPGSIAWMGYATTLYQFPLGLVATAISFAILPTLSRQAGRRDAESLAAFKATLGQGLNLVVILIVPATVGLFVLARPIVALVFERGAFGPADTAQTALVLQVFLLGLTFAAVDQLLIFAFYARKDTLTPALVGVLSVVVYLTTALALIRPLGLLSLMVADALKQMTHAAVTGALLARRLNGLGRSGLWATTLKALVASGFLALAAGGALWGWGQVGGPGGEVGKAVAALGPSVVGFGTYLAAISALNVPEARLAASSIRARVLGPRPEV